MTIQTSISDTLRLGLCALLIGTLPMQVQAQLVDISAFPMSKTSTAAVRANMMFIMDDSGSMDWDFLPNDQVGYCFGFNRINRMFYNPALTYTPPTNADGTPFLDASFSAARTNGYSATSSTVNLSTLVNLTTDPVVVGPSTTKYYYSTPIDPTITPCSSSTTNSVRWAVTTVLPLAQQVNYANWYSYYRTRLLTMKAAVGRVMARIDGTRFRIGYSAISSNTLATSAKFLPIGDFDVGTQKADFYQRLYAETASSSTPLRPALEKIGKYYAKKTLTGAALPVGVADPLQYACQKNYAILTTDGYWNTGNEGDLRPSYSPTRLDGTTAIGNVDAGAGVPRPLRDDGRSVSGNWLTGGAGVANTLADIAQYFYITDLRTGAAGSAACVGSVAGQDVCDDKVVPSGVDTAKHQHMTTYSLGLGIAGELTYRSDYETAATGSFADIKSGTRAWPNPNPSSTSGTVAARADDLWHAAVNGRGRYYSASDPNELVVGLTGALDAISSVAGVAASAATSSLQPVSGDNFMFIGEYTTVLWEGNVRAHTIDPKTGTVSSTPFWEAKDTLRAQVGTNTDTRKILFRNTGGTLVDFNAANLTVAGQSTHFANMCMAGSNKLSQCKDLSAAQKLAANKIENVVNYTRGQRAFENATANAVVDARVFRSRVNTPLGDVINASPVYVKAPPFTYAGASNPGHAAFKSAAASRQGVVYLASNDGMLHALKAEDGTELWAYVPTMAMPGMHRRADENYGLNHKYSVDGSPVVGDVYDGTSWRTILVAGLNSGGRGYYALDITDPLAPKALWELTNASEPGLADLGLTYGNPIITKNKLNNWVVAFTSGYNNHLAGGNGNGHVYVRDAITGAHYQKISTLIPGGSPAGTTSTPSNLGKMAAWVDDSSNNVAARLYAGDMQGSVWRIDFDALVGAGGVEATRMAQLRGPSNAPQPITTPPMLTSVGTSKIPVVTVATGRYLGAPDPGDKSVQSIYSFKDDLSSSTLGILRNRSDMLQKSFTNVGVTRQLSSTAMNWSTKVGWFADFNLSAGERVNVAMAQAGGSIGVATNIPNPSACNAGGTSWTYSLGVATGTVRTAVEVEAMAAGVNVVVLPTGTQFMEIDDNGAVHIFKECTVGCSAGATAVSRRSWRELINGR